MIGETITTRRPFPIGGIVWGLITALFLVGAAISRNLELGVAALLPLFCSLALFLLLSPRFTARFSDEGIELLPGGTLIPYDTIDEVSLPDKGARQGGRSFPIRIFYRRGFFTIPALADGASPEVYEFLSAQVQGAAPSPPATPELLEYCEHQEELFGVNKVWVYRGRAPLKVVREGRGGRVAGVAMMAAGVAWIIRAVADPALKAWAVAGISALVIGGLVLLLGWLIGRPRRHRGWRTACLIISPAGIALVQRDLRGELLWDELRDVKFRQRAAAFGLTPADVTAGILLKVEGAYLFILDMYHRPLREIHERILDYWQ